MHYDCNPSYNIFSVCVFVFYFALLLAVIAKTKVANSQLLYIKFSMYLFDTLNEFMTGINRKDNIGRVVLSVRPY